MTTVPSTGSFHALIEDLAVRRANEIAVFEGARAITFGDLWRESGRSAAALLDAGVRRGDVVGIAVPRSIELMCAVFGVLRAGAVTLPLDLTAPEARIRKLLQTSQAKLVLGSSLPGAEGVPVVPYEGESGRVPAREVPVDAEDGAFLVFTSGSSGEPKGVLLSHRAAVVRSRVEFESYAFSFSDRYLLRTNASLIGLPVALEILAAGVPMVVVSEGRGDDPRALRLAIRDHGVTFMGMPPKLIEDLLGVVESPDDLGSLRIIRSSGEALSTELAARCRAAIPRARLVDGYGTTEAGGVLTVEEIDSPPQNPRAGGVVLKTVNLRLADEGGRETDDGELWVSTPMLATGYATGEDPGAPKFVNLVGPDGVRTKYYRTGDRARIDGAGRLHLMGRMDVTLNVDAMRIDPVEVETALLEHPAVRQAAVWAHPNEEGRLRLVAYTVSDGEAPSGVELRAFLAGRLRRPLIPARFVALEALPRTSSGKVDRRALPPPGELKPTAEEHSDDLKARLLRIFRDVLEVPTFGPCDDFFEWNGDSLKAVRLMARVADEVGVSLPAAQLLRMPTVALLAAEIRRARPASPDPRGRVMPTWFGSRRGDTALVCLPGALGEALIFEPLSKHLVRESAVLGLSFVELRMPLSIDEIADLATQTLLDAVPRGPYRLLGYSIGGLVAIEVVRRLKARGQDVAFLGLIDTYLPDIERRRDTSRLAILKHRLKRFRNYTLRPILIRLGAKPTAHNRPESAIRAFSAAFTTAMRRHPLVLCEADAVLFRARESRIVDRTNGLGPFLRRMEIVDVPGEHARMMDGKCDELYARIAEALRRSG